MSSKIVLFESTAQELEKQELEVHFPLVFEIIYRSSNRSYLIGCQWLGIRRFALPVT